jgi:hypothetical protein
MLLTLLTACNVRDAFSESKPPWLGAYQDAMLNAPSVVALDRGFSRAPSPGPTMLSGWDGPVVWVWCAGCVADGAAVISYKHKPSLSRILSHTRNNIS